MKVAERSQFGPFLAMQDLLERGSWCLWDGHDTTLQFVFILTWPWKTSVPHLCCPAVQELPGKPVVGRTQKAKESPGLAPSAVSPSAPCPLHIPALPEVPRWAHCSGAAPHCLGGHQLLHLASSSLLGSHTQPWLKHCSNTTSHLLRGISNQFHVPA